MKLINNHHLVPSYRMNVWIFTSTIHTSLQDMELSTEQLYVSWNGVVVTFPPYKFI